jgi:sugar lactone lactonase YvrE
MANGKWQMLNGKWPGRQFYTFALCLLPFAMPFAARPALAFDSIQLKKTIPAPPALKSSALTGVAVDATGRLWITDSLNNQVHLYSAEGEYLQSFGGRGIGAAQFMSPHGIAVSPNGQIYVADSGNQRIQILSPDGKFLQSFGQKGTDPGQFHTPWLVAVSRDNVVLVTEKDGSRVQFFSKDGVFLHTIDVGTPIDGLAVDQAGRLFTAHRKLKLIEQWSSAGQLLRTYTGVEPGMKGFSEPQNLAVSESGLLYVADTDLNQFRELDLSGHTLGVFGRSGNGDGQFRTMEGVAVLNDTLIVCDSKSKKATVFTLSWQNPLPAMAPVPVARLQVNRADGLNLDVDRLAWNPDGTLHTLSASRDEIITYDLSTGTSVQINLKKDLGLKNPAGLATAPSSGSLFVSDTGGDRVVKLDKTGKLLLEFGKSTSMFKSGQGELSKPQGLTCSPQGVLFVADSGNSRFQAFNHQALFQFSGGEKGSGPGQIKNPTGIAWDKDRVYVADAGNKKVVTFNTSGRYIRELGTMGPELLSEPRQVAVDREGNLFVLDVALGRILAYDPQGVYIGGFGSAGKAPGFLNKPKDFALNDNGDLYVAEEGRVQAFRVVLLPPAPTNLSAVAGEGFVTLKWDPVKTLFPARYVVYRSTPLGEVQKVKDSVDTTVTDDTLIANTTYNYTVAAQSVQGALSVPSAPVQASAKPLVSGPRLDIASAQIDDIFSAQYKYYSRVPAGKVVIRNNGAAPVQKLKVSFAIQGYMDYPSETSIAELHSMEEKEVPFLATFNNHILEVTETTPIEAQVKLTYYTGDQATSFDRNLPIKLYSRNSIRWVNKERFASFVTPDDPSIIDFARGIDVPFSEAHKGAPLPTPMITAWSVFSGLGTYGISYLPRPNNPYDRVSLDSTTVDTLQFARETLARKSGDCADVVALLASALESLTVTTCALDAPGHLFLMFDTGETNKDALGFPDSMVVLYAGSYWIPVEATMLGSSFLEAWKHGAEEYHRYSAAGQLHPIDMHLAWRTYEPVTLTEAAASATPPTRQTIEDKFLDDWKALVDLKWQTVATEAKHASTADPSSGKPWLRLGFLAVDFHRFDDAKDYFMKARQDPATAAAAYNNLGNLAYIKGDMDTALSDYTQAREKDPTDPEISLNIVRVNLKQGHAQKASEEYEKAMALDKSLKEQYPDVSALTP